MERIYCHVSKKTYAYGAIRAENQNLLFTISELKPARQMLGKVQRSNVRSRPLVLYNLRTTPKSYDTTYVVRKTRFSKEPTLSKSLDTTYVVSKPKINVGSTSKANDKVVQIVCGLLIVVVQAL
ncbi:hypothetical protein Tco_0862498 [Tanacetum coccineum]